LIFTPGDISILAHSSAQWLIAKISQPGMAGECAGWYQGFCINYGLCATPDNYPPELVSLLSFQPLL
jgi:hypothetical protein